MMDGFSKINLQKSSNKNFSEVSKTKKSGIFRYIGICVLVIIVLILSVTALAFFPARAVYFSVQKTAMTGKELYGFAKNQDLENTAVKLSEIEQNLTEVEENVNKLNWIKFIPFIGLYENDAQHFARAAKATVQAGKITSDTLIPYADLLGLKGKSTFVAGSADDRIKTAVETLDKIIPNVDQIAQKLDRAEKELSYIDFNRYPEKIGNAEVRTRLQTGKAVFTSTAKLFVDAQPLLKKIPDLLGLKSPKRYFVLFQNDAEARATGGFITAYGIFKIDKGKIQVEKADDIYKLDESKNKKYPAPSPIIKYHQNVSNFQLRDNNLSPDFMESMKSFETMLKDSVPDFPAFDGIIALDTHVLVSTINILGEFNIYGRSFSAESDKRCDCPKVIYELEDYSTRPVAYVREERKDIIGVLLYQIMQRALGVSPSQYWGRLSQVFLSEAQQKHILFYFHDVDAQKGIESVNFGGRISSFEGDYLHINDVNFAGAKSNLFVEEYVKQDVQLAGDGSATTTLTINYKNPAPASNCNLEAGQLCLNGILRNWLRVYVPEESTLIEFTGSEKETVTYKEQGKTVFEGFLTVKPQGTAEVKIKYKTPPVVQNGKSYTLLIQKQPKTIDAEYTIVVNGKQIEKFKLVTDKEIKVNR